MMVSENQELFLQVAGTFLSTLLPLLILGGRVLSKRLIAQLNAPLTPPTLSSHLIPSTSNGNGYRAAIDMSRGLGYIAKQAQDCEDNMERLEKDNEVLRQRVEQQERQMRRVELHNATLEAKIVALEKQLHEKDDQIADLEKRLAELEGGPKPPKTLSINPPVLPDEEEDDAGEDDAIEDQAA